MGSNFEKKIELNKSIKIFINYLLGPLFFIWLGFSLYHQIRNQPDIHANITYIKEAAYGPFAFKFWCVVALMLVNWGIEALKWKLLMKPLEDIDYLSAVKAIFAGVAFALNTPNRIGEYGGRILYIKEGNRLKAVSLTIIGSFSQLIVTLGFGVVGLLVMQNDIVTIPVLKHFQWGLKWLPFVVSIVTIALLLLYFKTSKVIARIEKARFLKKWVQYFSLLENVSLHILLKVMGLSVIRFLIFCLQYHLLLQVMHVQIDGFIGFWLVTIIFLMLAIWPTIALLELGLRWEYNLLLFGLFSTNVVGIYAVATGIWLINLVLPAIIGTLFMLSVKVFKEA